MPGSGKYTKYYNTAFADNEEKKTVLESIFSKGAFTGDEPYNQELVIKTANERILAIGDSESGTEYLQNGDPVIFPQGVYMDFRGTPENETAADNSEVTWTKEGDPINPYTPDVRSPGHANADLTDHNTVIANTDPVNGGARSVEPGDLAEVNVLNPNYVPANSESDREENKGTRNPYHTGKRIHEVASISVDKSLKLGSSMKFKDDQ
jgi:hypothetical protein